MVQKGRIGFGEIFNAAHFFGGIGLSKNQFVLLMPGSAGVSQAVPFFLGRIFLGEEESKFLTGRLGPWGFSLKEYDKAGFFFVVTGEVIEIIFLGRRLGLGEFFAAGFPFGGRWGLHIPRNLARRAA